MLRNPHIAGVERFEAPFSINSLADGRVQRKALAAQFCLLLWQHFQSEVRTIRYTINSDHLEDTTVEFTQQPRYEDLLKVDTSQAQQIDIECIGQQPSPSRRDAPVSFGSKDDYFPAFLEVFIPLSHTHTQVEPPPPDHFIRDHLVIWCRPHLLPEITALWEQAVSLLINQA